jgi:clan AA aspartic protease (TIGR02281 family)
MDKAEDDKIINCPRCDIANPVESDICYNCGASLHEVPPQKASRTWISVLAFFLFSVGAIFIYYFYSKTITPQPLSTVNTPAVTSTVSERKAKLTENSLLTEKPDGSAPESKKINLPLGSVLIRDVTGNLIAEIQVPIVGGGWIALPTRVCLGGYEWMLQLSTQVRLEIEGGIVNDENRIGLWRIREDQHIEGPELHPWSPEMPLTWLPLGSQEPLESAEFKVNAEEGNFIRGSLPQDFDEAGVFIQDGRVVGWTFENGSDGAFLWIGDEGSNLKAEIRVDDYYRITFANSREEEFTLALDLGDDYSALDRLEAFTQAFRFESKLSAEDTPAHLKSEVISTRLRSLVARAVQEGFAVQVANYFDAEILTEAADISLLSDLVLLTAESYGFEEAINLIEDAMDKFQPKNDPDKVQLNEIHSGLYQNWLTSLIESGESQNAWRAFERGRERLPDDLSIHLLGVKLALEEDGWAAAEELLSMKEYPPALIDRVKSLQAQISELKGQQGKIVIRFTPGIRQIPVTALLDRGVSQNFIVDTGASLVTIPYSTAADIGLTITDRNPRRTVYTAGGVQYAPEVMLSSITLEGWEINNVRALVMDLPNQPDWGLLGLNYLQRFRMDLNTQDGVLLLEPR